MDSFLSKETLIGAKDGLKAWEDSVLQSVDDLGIPSINIQSEVFSKFRDLSSFRPLIGTHYSAEGHRLVAEAIIEHLRRDLN